MTNNRVLVYIPNGLNTPELEILLSQAQREVKKKKEVDILLCSGGNNYHCSKNIYSLKSICYACKTRRSNGIKKLKGNFNLIYTPKIQNIKLAKKNFDFNSTFDYKYKGIDNGLSAYCSYVELTRDRDLDGNIANTIIQKLVNTSNQLTDYFFKLLKNKYTKIYMFNGRNNNYRPLLQVSKIFKKEIHNLEFSGDRNRIFDLKHFLPFDSNFIANEIENFWKKTKKKNLKLIDKYILMWEKFQTQKHKEFFSVKQKKNLLPSKWNNTKRNIVFFCNSEDESLTGGRDHFYKVFENQRDAIEKIYKMIKTQDGFKTIDFWIRMHPRMTGLNWNFLKETINLKKKYSDLNLIIPKSKTSSYAMLKKSSLIIAPASSLSMEAVHHNIPVINIQNEPFAVLKGSYLPKSEDDFKKLIFNKKLKPRSVIAQKKFHLFWLTGGFHYSEIEGNFRGKSYTYKKEIIRMSLSSKIIYYIGKFSEKYLYTYFFNYYLYRLKSKLNKFSL